MIIQYITMKPSYHWSTETVALSPEQALKNAIIDYVNAHDTFTVAALTEQLRIRFKDQPKEYANVNNFLTSLKQRRSIVAQPNGRYFRVSKIEYKYA